MKNSMKIFTALFLFASIRDSESCTSILIGPDASEDGMGFVGQSDDGEGAGDRRLVYVSPQTHAAGDKRPIIDYSDFPRYVGYERKVPEYYPSEQLPNETKNIIGYIPQVQRTFGYYEANYAIANDAGVQFGESTCSAKIYSKSVSNYCSSQRRTRQRLSINSEGILLV